MTLSIPPHEISRPSFAISRRSFIKSCACAAFAPGLLQAERPFISEQPAGRQDSTGPAGGAASGRWLVACRDVYLKISGKPDCWSAMKDLGVAGIEVEVDEELRCTSLLHPKKKYALATSDGVKELKDDLGSSGGAITAFCMYNRLDERLERELSWTEKLLKASQTLGVGVIRIDVVPRAIAADQFLPFAVKACKRLCEIAEGSAVRFGIENHGQITNDPAFLEKLFDGVGSTRLGLTLDAMNFYWFGHPLNDLYGIYEKLAPRAFHTHCKNLRYPDDKKNVRRPMGWEYEKYAAPIYEGDIDYKRFTEILRKAGYGGDLCLENECLGRFPQEQRAGVLKREIALLKSIA